MSFEQERAGNPYKLFTTQEAQSLMDSMPVLRRNADSVVEAITISSLSLGVNLDAIELSCPIQDPTEEQRDMIEVAGIISSADETRRSDLLNGMWNVLREKFKGLTDKERQNFLQITDISIYERASSLFLPPEDS